ncbi:MAG: SPOR domain-containing protein [Proteobacteria bacterium]|nr:SPOR domain-containing protein [Pseudomonadota bacterium]MBU1386399.1 SPOR domain-containing protein [Pseudomonadota bacterium]MBU1544510.1 SPOR domain-containing protein [Pseudomonadota bacterium]MBU2429753.1 SPOR domain-containing protein [Pseudomonadota bacterium]MBU2480416.1 SPOR domain-containing protein [Pseudomonadota bacterium]
MIRIIRYIGVYLWLTVLFAVPAVFFIISVSVRFGFSLSPISIGILVFVLTGFLIGFLMNTIAKKWIISLIKEGQAWERSGWVEKAKKKYILALRVFDTFLLFPLSDKKTAKKITGVIAGFWLNNPGDHPNFKLGTAMYLKTNPMDTNIAGLWLSRISQANIVTSLEQDVLYVLAQAHMENIRLLPLLANIFLGLQRSDLVAKKIYQQVMARPDLAKIYQSRICELTDEPEDNLIRQAVFFMPEQVPEKTDQIGETGRKFVSGVWFTVKNVWIFFVQMPRSAAHHIFLFFRRSVVYFKVHEKFRSYLTTGILGLFLAGFIFFMVSTLSHTLKTRVTKDTPAVPEKIIPKPFTIQVAAYLTLSHAQNYVDSLKKKQIDASIKKVEGGGKTWFVVRVSEFEDKHSATDYGNKLKQQHLIDDFFVNNR